MITELLFAPITARFILRQYLNYKSRITPISANVFKGLQSNKAYVVDVTVKNSLHTKIQKFRYQSYDYIDTMPVIFHMSPNYKFTPSDESSLGYIGEINTKTAAAKSNIIHVDKGEEFYPYVQEFLYKIYLGDDEQLLNKKIAEEYTPMASLCFAIGLGGVITSFMAYVYLKTI